jgi:hypothetical protein
MLGEIAMRTIQRPFTISCLATLLAACGGNEPTAPAVAIDSDDIGGTVNGPAGPEAGVWVIAETEDFDTRYAKIVVTDDQGRYVVPDLPPANYQVWVRGYGLVDSPKVAGSPGQTLNLTASAAASPAEAAVVYPAAYWYSMMKVPSADEVGSLAGGVNQYLASVKNLSCIGCHQIGQLATRTLPPEFSSMSHHDAWVRRIQSGQAGAQMLGSAMNQLGGVPAKYLAEWTERVANGELPHAQPQRPRGVERNIVATVRDWSNEKAYMHDLSGTDRRNPTVNAYGKLYGAPELSTDEFPILDPMTNTATVLHAPVEDPNTPTTNSTPATQPSAYWGSEAIWDSKANAHNPMLERRPRLATAVVRAPDNARFAKRLGPSVGETVSAGAAGRQLSVYDRRPRTHVHQCYRRSLAVRRGRERHAGRAAASRCQWLNKLFSRPATRALKVTALVLDTNGNGKRDAYVEPNEPVDPTKDKRVNSGFYAVMPNPADGSIWGSTIGYPGAVVRLDPGSNPPETALAEVYTPPLPGYGIRGADIDRNGVVWMSMGSGHLGSFDRSKCMGPLNGPAATGNHCPEGWSFYRYPGPGFVGRPDESVESSYYSWVDQHNTSGLGPNVPMSTANLFDGVHALVDGEMMTLRIPYPLGFYSKGFEGRIDDPNAGWKGRGLWVPSGDRTPWLKEGGKGTKPLVVHFQVRPDPLAK